MGNGILESDLYGLETDLYPKADAEQRGESPYASGLFPVYI